MTVVVCRRAFALCSDDRGWVPRGTDPATKTEFAEAVDGDSEEVPNCQPYPGATARRSQTRAVSCLRVQVTFGQLSAIFDEEKAFKEAAATCVCPVALNWRSSDKQEIAKR